jgi:ribosomal protein L11 methyltransferase
VKWIELSVEVHPEAVDAVSNVFREHGTGGVVIEQPISADDEGEQPPSFVGMPLVKAYLPDGANAGLHERRIEEALWHLQAFNLSPLGSMQRRVVDEEDWANAWKEHLHPIRIGRVVIKPTWRSWEAEEGDIIVELDPGMAFGTGLHPTTSLVLLALQERIRPGMRVLDLGTGSGILALAAAKLGASVTALDISDIAVRVARDNVEANQLTDAIEVAEGSIEAVQGHRFDLILANIIARVLIDLAPQLADALQPEADLLASGIIEERADDVRTAFRAAGLDVASEASEGDWWLLIATRRG